MRVPRLQRYYQDAPIPCHSFRVAPFPLLGDTTGAIGYFRVSRRHHLQSDRPGVGNPVSPAGIFRVEMAGPPKFLGNPNVHLLMFFDPGRTNDAYQFASLVLLPLKRKRKLRRKFLFRGSIAWLLNSLSTLRSAGYPGPTQDSLPAAG